MACCFFFHQWSQWADMRSGSLRYGEHVRCGFYVLQARRCDRCGKVQIRTATC